MKDSDCVAFLQWALPRLRLRWSGFRKVRRQVCKRIGRRLSQLGFDDLTAYRSRLESNPAEWSVLDACCRITVSHFYRDRGVFEQLSSEVLPALAQAAPGREESLLRAWSVGCASGEEPFSLKMLWEFAVRHRFPGLELHITATDASARLLERAQRACYGAATLRELPAGWRDRAFGSTDKLYCLRKKFHEGIDFRCEDIRVEQTEGPFDLVLCRNLVFTYFEEALQLDILPRLVGRLVPGGALVIGRHESLPAGELGLTPWPGCPCVHRR